MPYLYILSFNTLGPNRLVINEAIFNKKLLYILLVYIYLYGKIRIRGPLTYLRLTDSNVFWAGTHLLYNLSRNEINIAIPGFNQLTFKYENFNYWTLHREIFWKNWKSTKTAPTTFWTRQRITETKYRSRNSQKDRNHTTIPVQCSGVPQMHEDVSMGYRYETRTTMHNLPCYNEMLPVQLFEI